MAKITRKEIKNISHLRSLFENQRKKDNTKEASMFWLNLFFRNYFRAKLYLPNYRIPTLSFIWNRTRETHRTHSSLLLFSYFFLSASTLPASLSYISATPSLPRKLHEAISVPDSVNLAMDSCKSKPGFSMRPVRRARGDPRRTLIIKDGWTSYHVQGKGILTILTTYVFVYSAGVK